MTRKVTLEEIAHKALLDKGFVPDFPEPVLKELEAIQRPAPPYNTLRDMRNLLWVSIDNENSRDLDQLTYAEKDRIYVAIADVDALVKKGSAIDNQAAHNTTSIYTPTLVFPMLPLKLSTNLTSLNENSDRCAIVIEVRVDPDGNFYLKDIYPALVRNRAKLDYVSVGAWLEGNISKKNLPPITGLRQQLKLQDQLAQQILHYRNTKGALEFGEIELKTVVVDGIPVSLEAEGKNRAHSLIENYMIAANVAATQFLKERKIHAIRRVVRKPKRWDRIVTLAGSLGADLPQIPDPVALRAFLLDQQQKNPLHFPDLSLAVIKLLGRGEYVLYVPGKPEIGHFDLAEHEYTHATAPNRRFPDLVMQRLLKRALRRKEAAYTNVELAQIATHCTQKEDDATKVERRLMKCAAAIVLQKEIGHNFNAMVTGASPKGTWVRLQTPPVEGKLTKGFEEVDVGDFIHVKLIHVDVMNGHIDFAREA